MILAGDTYSLVLSLKPQPFYRTQEVAESTTGGAYLYGAELSGAFQSLFPSDLSKPFKGGL